MSRLCKQCTSHCRLLLRRVCLCVFGPAVVLSLWLPEKSSHGYVAAPLSTGRILAKEPALGVRRSRCASATALRCSRHPWIVPDSAMARRETALLIAALVSPTVLTDSSLVRAAAGDQLGPIAVLGAGGRTGKLCVEVLRASGRPAMALSRAEADVSKASVEDLARAVQGAKAVIFASSASSKGGDSKQVDEQGAIKAAQACVLAGVPKYVLISSGGVARPGSIGYLATNWMPGATWGIMDAKARGEEGVKAALRGSKTRYTVLRPGGLEDSVALGPRAMELNQGDAMGGLVSRSDVAAAAVAAADSPDTDDTTFELYAYGDAFAQKPGPTDFGLPSGPTGYERRGTSWPELFMGLKKDFAKL